MEKIMRSKPIRELVSMSLPARSRSGSPADVSTVTDPIRTERKARPPETAKTTVRIDFTKGAPEGSVERQPSTVQ